MPTPFIRIARSLVPLLAIVLAACTAEPDAEQAAAASDTTAAMGGAAADTAAAPATSAEKVNLNTATREDFLALPGVSERMVGEFMEYRPYVSIQQFRREIGKYVDEAQVTAYEEYVFVPVDFNESDAETLAQIPGLDASEAGELVAARPYASREAFLEELSGYVAQDERASAEHYLAAP